MRRACESIKMGRVEMYNMLSADFDKTEAELKTNSLGQFRTAQQFAKFILQTHYPFNINVHSVL